MVNSLPANLPDANSPPWKPLGMSWGAHRRRVKAGVRVKVVWTFRDWVDAVAALPVQEPLPCRIVLVRRERVAHSLRRDLIRNGLGSVLAGTRFVPFSVAAAGSTSQFRHQV